MWGKNENQKPAGAPKPFGAPEAEEKPAPYAGVKSEPADPPAQATASSSRATIGRTIVMKAQISGSEDLYIDGELEGAVELPGHNLTVGPNGKVSANVVARNISVHGTLLGNVQASEKIEIRKTGSLLGDVTTAGITIEDGAYFKGSIDILKPSPADRKAKPAKPGAETPAPTAPKAAAV
jgi:cytoskeletal protein CcmA (bactofilin family)